MVEQFPSHLSYLDRSQQRGPHGGHNHCNGQTSSQLFVNDILTELKCLDNSIPLFCCTLIPWHNWLKAQYPDTLIGASIPQYPDLIGAKCMSKIPYRYDPFGERYIRYCCDLIGARYLPVKQKFCKGGLNQWQGSITTRGFRGSEPRVYVRGGIWTGVSEFSVTPVLIPHNLILHDEFSSWIKKTMPKTIN